MHLQARKSPPYKLDSAWPLLSPRDLCIPSFLSKLSSQSMTVKVSSGTNLCKSYGLNSPGISVVSAVSPPLQLPHTLHNHFQLASRSLTQGYNSDCHPPCLRGLFAAPHLAWGPAFGQSSTSPGRRDEVPGLRRLAHAAGPSEALGSELCVQDPQEQKLGDRGQPAVTCPRSDPQQSPNEPLLCQGCSRSSAACYRKPPCHGQHKGHHREKKNRPGLPRTSYWKIHAGLCGDSGLLAAETCVFFKTVCFTSTLRN